MVFLRRTRHVVSIVTLLICLHALGCALLAKADQSKPNDPQQNGTRTQGPAATPAINLPTGSPSQQDAGGQQKAAHDLREFAIERLIDPVTWFTGLLLITAFLQWLVTRKQATLMNRQNQIMDRQSTIMESQTSAMHAQLAMTYAVQRPLVNGAGYKWFYHRSGVTGVYSFSFEPILANTGPIPTRDLRVATQYRLVEGLLPTGYEFPIEYPLGPVGPISSPV